MGRFDDKHVLVTGATAGIGLAGARRLAAEGARLTLTGRDPGRLSDLAKALPEALVLSNDAGEPDCGDELEAAVHERGLAIDGLWLNAGYAEVGSLLDVDVGMFDRMMAANVRGPMLQMASLEPHLSDGASVLLTASTAAYEGPPLASVYAATKGAAVSLGRNWATALAPRGIRANVLVPGAIETGFRAFMGADQRESFEADVMSRTPLGRVGTPDEAAAVALFLLSDDSAYVTASQYAVDGGLTRR